MLRIIPSIGRFGMRLGVAISLILSFVLLLSACQKEEDKTEPISEPSDYRGVEVVTGLQLRDVQGQDLVRLGNPNERRLGSAVYPNPCEQAVSVYSPNGIQRAWILPGEQDRFYDEEPLLDSLLIVHQYDIAEIEIQAIDTVNVATSGQEFVYLNTLDLEVGFYRVFVEDSLGEVLSHNVYKVLDYEAVTFDYGGFIESVWPE